MQKVKEIKRNQQIPKIASLKPLFYNPLSNILDSNTLTTEKIFLKKTKPKAHFEIGLTGKVGSSILMGTTTNKALELTSMIKTKIKSAGGFGIALGYFFGKRNGLLLTVFPMVSTKQYFGGYTTEGWFYNKEIRLDFLELFLSYQRNLIHYCLFNQKSNFYTRFDYSLGYLSKAEELINNEFIKKLSKNELFEHRLGLAIGNAHYFNHFKIDYGLNGYISLQPSLSNMNQISTSNTLIFGAFLGIYYTI